MRARSCVVARLELDLAEQRNVAGNARIKRVDCLRNLERVGDQAVNIAERVMDMVDMPAADLPVDIPRMASAASAMVQRSSPGGPRTCPQCGHEIEVRDEVSGGYTEESTTEFGVRMRAEMGVAPEGQTNGHDALI